MAVSPSKFTYSTHCCASSQVPDRDWHRCRVRRRVERCSRETRAYRTGYLRLFPTPSRGVGAANLAGRFHPSSCNLDEKLPPGQRSNVTCRSFAAFNTSLRKPSESDSREPSSKTPPSMQRPRCSMKFPYSLGSIRPMMRSVTTLMRAAWEVVCCPFRMAGAPMSSAEKSRRERSELNDRGDILRDPIESLPQRSVPAVYIF
jgi:hypothetical protein